MGPLLEGNSEAAFVAILEPGPHFGVRCCTWPAQQQRLDQGPGGIWERRKKLRKTRNTGNTFHLDKAQPFFKLLKIRFENIVD